jgi:hypothetical protein
MTTANLEGQYSMASSQEPSAKKEVNDFWERQARRMSRNLLLAFLLSVVAIAVRKFSTSSENGGWEYLGSLISDRRINRTVTLTSTYPSISPAAVQAKLPR